MSTANKAILSEEDRRLFFRLFIPLLQFTNHKFEINEYLDEDLRAGHPYIERTDYGIIPIPSMNSWKLTKTN